MNQRVSFLARVSMPLALGMLLAATPPAQQQIERCPVPQPSAGVHLLCIGSVTPPAREYFALYLPTNDPDHLAPLVVGFHGFCGNFPDQFVPKLMEVLDYLGANGGELDNRDWYGLAPLGRHDNTIAGMSFSSLNSQNNIENVMHWVLDRYNIDKNRIYGTGFSMGGGTVTSFAARHLDPTDFMFAAIVDHTGAVALRDLYYCTTNPGQGLATIFGGSPDQLPFSYARSSAMDYVSCLPPQALLYPERTLARNLTHIPTRIGYAAGDTTPQLVHQSNVLWQVLKWVYLHPDPGPNPASGTSPWVSSGSGHSWYTMPASLVFSFFDSVPSVTLPASARTLVDRNGRWFHFGVEQTQVDVFTPIDWSVSTSPGQELRLENVENLDRIHVHDDDLPFNYSLNLQVVVQADQGGMGDVVLEGYAASPAQVTISGGGTANWSWNQGLLTLLESSYPPNSTQTFTWTIFP